MNSNYPYSNAILRRRFFILLAMLLAALGGMPGLAVTFTNQMDASLVLGKSNFTGSAAASPAASLKSPAQCIISPGGKLIVSEQGGTGAGRVVIWNSVPTTNGAAADVVLGRTSFTDTVTGTTAIKTNQVVSGVLATPDGKLIITDDLNNRVLIWNSIPTVSGTAADVVIGQTSMTTGTAGISASAMNSPRNVLLTPDGKLLVSDYGNSRVLIFNSVPTSNGAAANVVIGQTSLTTRTRGLGASECGGPYGLALSSTGRLVISDLDVHRVLVYNTVPTSNGAAADVVIGQTGFGLEGSGTTASRMNLPGFIGISPTGQLAVGELSNNRVIIFNSIPTTNGAAANVVLGQPNFTTGLSDNGGTSAHSLYNPCASFTQDGRLFVGDRFNGRVLVFGSAAPAVTTPTSSSIATTSATLGGNVVTDGGANITERGVVYALTSANADPLINGSGVAKVVAGGTTGVFTVSVTGLSAGRGYSFKAYATNSVGTTYTTPVATFTTGLGSTVVINTNDSGIGSLRQAVLNANANPGADAITFDPTVFATAQTINITSSLPAFTGDTSVTGPAAGVTVNSGVVSIAFTVAAATTASFTGLTISGGIEGIRNNGTLTASNCVFRTPGNAGIYNSNVATATGCTFDRGSQGIENNGTLTVSNSTFIGVVNAGISNGNSAVVSNCTFSGGASLFNGGTATATNCTFSGNTGSVENYDQMTLINCTCGPAIVGGFGIVSDPGSTLTLKNTLSIGISGTYTNGGGNLIAASAAAAGLDPTGLQSNGGPTKTIALVSGSPAINGGLDANVPVGITTDQRGSGFPRLVGTVDIGAYEAPLPPAVIAWDDFLRQQDSGAGWSSNWSVAPPIGVNLVYPGLNSGGYAAGGPVNFPGALRDLPAQTTGVVYLSALISGTSYANVTLYNGASELLGFGIVYSGTGPATQYGAFDNTRNLRSYSTVNVNGARHLIVIRVDLDANTFAGWVDPNLAAPLGAPAFSSSTTFATGYDFNRLRLELGPGSQVDELRVVRWDPELLETQTTSPAVSAPVAFGLTDSAASLSATVAGGGLPITEVGVVYAPTSVDADPNPGDAGVIQVSGAAFPVGVAGRVV